MADKKNILDEEHKELIEMIEEISSDKTEVGKIFSRLLSLFGRHLDKENEMVGPLLAYLRTRLGDYREKDRDTLNVARAKFEDSYQEMMKEHREMEKLIKLAQNSLKDKPDTFASNLAEHLIFHIRLENDLLYPAAFASGDLVEYEMDMIGDKIKH